MNTFNTLSWKIPSVRVMEYHYSYKKKLPKTVTDNLGIFQLSVLKVFMNGSSAY